MAPNGVRSAFCAYLAVPIAPILVQIGALVGEISHVFRVAHSERLFSTSIHIVDFRGAILVISGKLCRQHLEYIFLYLLS